MWADTYVFGRIYFPFRQSFSVVNRRHTRMGSRAVVRTCGQELSSLRCVVPSNQFVLILPPRWHVRGVATGQGAALRRSYIQTKLRGTLTVVVSHYGKKDAISGSFKLVEKTYCFRVYQAECLIVRQLSSNLVRTWIFRWLTRLRMPTRSRRRLWWRARRNYASSMTRNIRNLPSGCASFQVALGDPMWIIVIRCYTEWPIISVYVLIEMSL